MNASSPHTRKMPAVIAVARLRYLGSSSPSSFSKSRFTGIRTNAETAKQRKPLNVWAKMATTASTAETAKAIQRNILFSIIAFPSTIRTYAAVGQLCSAVSTHPSGRCICGRQSRMFLVHPEPECRRQDQGNAEPAGKGQKDNAGNNGSPENLGAFLVSGMCPDQNESQREKEDREQGDDAVLTVPRLFFCGCGIDGGGGLSGCEVPATALTQISLSSIGVFAILDDIGRMALDASWHDVSNPFLWCFWMPSILYKISINFSIERQIL